MIRSFVTSTNGARFTAAERKALRALRANYRAEQHLFTKRSLAHLQFLRWLFLHPKWNRAMDLPDNRSARPVEADFRVPALRALSQSMTGTGIAPGPLAPAFSFSRLSCADEIRFMMDRRR